MKYKCTVNPEHLFEIPTEDFWCPICSDNKGMLELLDSELKIDSADIKSNDKKENNGQNNTIDSGNYKVFNCGKCKAPFNVNLQAIARNKIIVVCDHCDAKNLVGFEHKTPIVHKPESKEVEHSSKRPLVKVMLNIENKGVVVKRGLNLGSNLIGRNDFKEDRFLSTKHCDIKLSIKSGNLKIHIVDLKSTNGTFDFNKNRMVPNQAYSVKMNVFYYIGSSKMKITI
jgi:DNA-directed RNA polymerase subunit RPC12/RpoP